MGTHHGKPGLVAVPDGLISSQQIQQCPVGVVMNSDLTCGPSHTPRAPSDVLGHGMALLKSTDGVHWTLFRKLWPFGGMYTTMAALTTDAHGAALTFGVLFSAGSLSGASDATGTIYYQNFTFSSSGIPNDSE